MNLFRNLTFLAGVIAISASSTGTALADPPANPDAGVVILMDRSGSMSETITNCAELPGSVYKWKCAVQKATNWISGTDTLTRMVGDTQVMGTYKYWFWQLRYFGEGDVVETDPVQYDRQGILNRLQGYQGPTVDDAATPLAQVACDAMDMIRRERLLENWQKSYIRLESDGLENASASTHKCYGAHSLTTYSATQAPTYSDPLNSIVATINALTVPTWESNMLAMGISGLLALPPAPSGFYTATQIQAYTPPSPNNPVIFDIDFFDNYVPAGGGGALALTPATGKHSVDISPIGAVANAAGVVSAAVNSNNPYDPYAAFLIGLAEVTGGRMVRYRSDGAGIPGTPSFTHVIPGDVDDSSCVDNADLTALLGVFGQKVSATNPVTYQADVTYDGVVDVHDYNLVLANWGVGCATTPPPAPLSMEVLFGFEDASKWSSRQATLTNKMSPTTGGTYSLNVGGTGLQTIQTARFSTAILHGVTSKIAYDVYVPNPQVDSHHLPKLTALLFTCPSAGLFDFPVGIADLSRKSVGSFTTVQFMLPSFVRRAMQSNHPDLTIQILIAAEDPGYVLDSLRFVQ